MACRSAPDDSYLPAANRLFDGSSLRRNSLKKKIPGKEVRLDGEPFINAVYLDQYSNL
jgi:hypothetical protein